MKIKQIGKKTTARNKRTRIISDNGDLFIVMRDNQRIALGLVARGGKRAGKLGYFFPIELYDRAKDVANFTIRPEQAIWVIKFGDLHILRGDWPIVGQLKGFSQEAWPMPLFFRRNENLEREYISKYDENDVTKLIDTWSIDQLPFDIENEIISTEGAAGAGYVEEYLMKLLGNDLN